MALLGWHVYPMSRASKAGCFKGAAEAATPDLDVLERWAKAYPGCNWRVVCGPSGLFALDVDRPGTHKADGFAALQQLLAVYGPLPVRPMTRTGGSGGAALFFKHQGEALRGESGRPAPGIDPHRGRQAIVIPPSRHPVTGGAYVWTFTPWEHNPPAIPAWLAEALRPPPEPVRVRHEWVPTDAHSRNALMRAFRAVSSASSGDANNTLNRAAYRLGSWCGAGYISQDEAEETLEAAALMRGIPVREARDTIRSGLTSGRKRPVEARYAGG